MKLGRVALVAVPLAAIATTPRVAHALNTAGQSPFDAYIASGDASCIELNVTTGYTFIVEPAARLPRATATISEGSSSALAAPADPGDSADALAGLLVPRAEGMLAAGLDQATSQIPVPVVPPGLTDSLIAQLANPVNPVLEYPYEHASAAYPNPQQPGDQQASYLGLPSATYTDPSGVLSLDGAAGDARAGATAASADSGAGAGLSLPSLGVTVGRVNSTSVAQLTSDIVSNDVTCRLQDVTVAPPAGGTTLHIGALVASLHTERKLGAPGATATKSLEVSDVSLNGTPVVPGNGTLPIPPTTVTLPQPPAPPPGAPAPPASLQSVSVSGTSSQSVMSAAGNEAASTFTAATVVIASTAPVPSSIPPAPGQNPISTTPAVYTLQLANLDSQTYGLPASTDAGSSGSSAGGLLGGSGGFGAGGRFGAGAHGTGRAGTAATGGAASPVSSLLIPGTPGAIRWGVVALAGALESLLLATVFLRRRGARRHIPEAPATTFLDLP